MDPIPILAADAANAASEAVSYWPFVVLAVGMAFVIVMIAALRVHAFLSLMLAAILVGFLATSLPESESGETNQILLAILLPMEEFGNTAGQIAWVIALAAVIGMALMESGAADRIVRQLIHWLGEPRAGWALLVSGFFLGIPVFFDTVFFLLIPLAQALSFRLGRNYVFYVTAVFSGAAITHSLVPPTPGPLVMVDSLELNLGQAMVIGLVMGVLPACGALMVGQRMDRRLNLPIREGPGLSLADLKANVSKSEEQLPPFFLSILPVALPVVLIAIDSSLSTLGIQDRLGAAYNWIAVLGNKFIAMFLGAVIALWLLAKQEQMTFATLGETMGPPLSTAGVIILITAAGGAFGTMIKLTGIGDSIKAATDGTGVSLIVVAWLVATIMKIAQGSGTVSMITTAGMMAGVVGDPASLGYDPLYLYLAIGFGSLMGSWMNDSGFWVVCKLSGFTAQETLKTWTITLAAISLIGFLQVILIASLVPYPFGTPQ